MARSLRPNQHKEFPFICTALMLVQMRATPLELYHPASVADGKDESHGHHVAQDGGAAVAQEWQGDAGDRHDAHGHGDVLEDLEDEHADESDDDEGAEQVGGFQGDAHEADHEVGKEADDNQAADQAQFFNDYGEDEVRLLNRDKVQGFLGAVEQAFAEYAAGSHGDLGFIHLVVGSDAQVVRVQEGADSLFLVGGHHHIGRRDQAGDDDQEFCEHFDAQTGEEYHGEPHGHEYQCASQVLLQDDSNDRSRKDSGFQESAEIVEFIVVLVQIIRHQQGEQNFYDLRRLNGGESEGDPGTGAELGHAESRNIYQEEQEQREYIQLFNSALENLIPDGHDDHHQSDSDNI